MKTKNNQRFSQRKTTLLLGAVLISLAFLFQRCAESKKEIPAPPIPKVVVNTTITPEPFPTIPNFNFPEDSTEIYTWLDNIDTTAIYNHAWGLWAGLTSKSTQVYGGDSLLIFETWPGITELQTLTKNNELEYIDKATRTGLNKPHQLGHITATVDSSLGFWVSVAYNKPAADYTLKNEVLKLSIQESYAKKDSIGNIPQFPQTSVTLKPTYFVGKLSDSLIQIPAWPGITTPKAFPNTEWNNVVYVDVTNSQTPNKPLTPVQKGVEPTEDAICNLSDFIYMPISAAMAKSLNEEQNSQGITAEAGDLAILVAMHATTKEISNWTWQSYYWSPNPDTPKLPGSEFAATLRNDYPLEGAASHYAVATTYSMVWPNQPITGGTNENVIPNIGYNPYLEADFGPDVFKYVPANNLNINFKYGVQTNCMTCHAFASLDVKLGANDTIQRYSTDQYVAVNDTSLFNNKVLLDFAWSLSANRINDK